jgi:hypothetical protein
MGGWLVMKKYLPIIAGVFALVAIVSFLRSCGLSEKYREQKLAYTELRAVTDADHAVQLLFIAERDKLIAQKDAEIVQYTERITTYQRQLSVLHTQLNELQNTEPPTTPEVESLPIVINLRGQVARLTEMFSVSQRIVSEENEIIKAWEVKFAAQVDISESWKKQYEDEHALRLACEGMNKTLENKVKTTRFRGKIWTAAALVAGGYAGYRLLTK